MPTVLMAYGSTPAASFTPRRHTKMCKDIRQWAKSGTAPTYSVTFSTVPPANGGFATSVTCIFDSQTNDRLTLTHGTYTANGNQGQPWNRTYSHSGGTRLNKTLYNILTTWQNDQNTISDHSETFIYLISESVRFEAIRILCSKWYRATGTPNGPSASAFLAALVTNNAAIRAHHAARKDIYDELTIQECLAHFAPVTSPTAPGIRVANDVRTGMDTYLGNCCR